MRALEDILLAHRDDFHRVVPFDPATHRLLLLDLTENNTDLQEGIINDVSAFSAYISNKLADAGAQYGVGGYNEHRTVYSRSGVFDDPNGEEPRRLHLGLDIWGDAGTPVFAPLDGIVHSFAFNNRYGDYGATIILEHELDGVKFCSLYGHLALRDLNITEGQQIKKGTVFAHFGMPEENGHWPPHVHVQLINNIGPYKGDYPGVCKYGERAAYLSNCPDPDLVAQMVQWV